MVVCTRTGLSVIEGHMTKKKPHVFPQSEQTESQTKTSGSSRTPGPGVSHSYSKQNHRSFGLEVQKLQHNWTHAKHTTESQLLPPTANVCGILCSDRQSLTHTGTWWHSDPTCCQQQVITERATAGSCLTIFSMSFERVGLDLLIPKILGMEEVSGPNEWGQVTHQTVFVSVPTCSKY